MFKIVNPRIVQKIIDLLKSDFQVNHIYVYAALLIGATFMQGIFLFLMRRTIIVASREIENDLRNDIFWKLETLTSTFYNRIPTGDIMSRTTNDMNAVRSILGPGIAYTINTIFAFLFVIPMMILINPLLTGLALLPFPLLALVVNRFGKAIYKRFERIQAQLARISTFVQENISGIGVVKSFVREKQQEEDFLRLNEDYMKRNIHYAKVNAAFHPTLMFIIGISTVLILLVGGNMVMNHLITIGEFTAFMLYLGMLIWPSIALGWVIGLFQQGSAAMKRIRLILDSEPDIEDGSHRLSIERFAGEIEFRDLNFQYVGEEPVLKNINLKIRPKQTVGFLGHTGSGKTSLVRLLPHFYPINEGQIFLDGMDINEYELKSLRSAIGFVTQDTFLFSDTLHNNIAFGRPDATRDEVITAAKIAQIHDEIMELPEGYDSVLGERGLNLSGGQKQRVSIARAILKNPRILILDDAFSALDTYTEETILKNLKVLFPDRTVIIISHRISTLQNADHIICLEEGKIVEQGTHQELLQLNGIYAGIYEKQLLEKELESVQ